MGDTPLSAAPCAGLLLQRAGGSPLPSQGRFSHSDFLPGGGCCRGHPGEQWPGAASRASRKLLGPALGTAVGGLTRWLAAVPVWQRERTLISPVQEQRSGSCGHPALMCLGRPSCCPELEFTSLCLLAVLQHEQGEPTGVEEPPPWSPGPAVPVDTE